MQATYSGADNRLKYLFQNANSVSVTQSLSSGTKIGSISIDGVSTDLYAPSGGGSSVHCNPIVDHGTPIAIFTISGTDYVIYSPVTSEVEFTDLIGDELNYSDGLNPPQFVYREDTYKIGELVINNGSEYRLTQDTSVDNSKTYYSRSETYSAVVTQVGDIPVVEGWYEYVNGQYVLSTDTSVMAGKTYYEVSYHYTAVTPSAGDNPAQQGWYEASNLPIPIYAPPPIAVEYNSNYNQGVLVGTLKVTKLVNDPNDETQPSVADTDTFDIIVPSGSGGGSIVSYSQLYPSTGEHIGTITIDGVAQNIYAPAGGGSGNVADVYVDGSSVLDANHIAQIDLTGYATDTELSTAIANLQASFQDGVDRIYEACVRKGSTPASHSLADVIDAIYAIGGNMDYRNVESTLTMNMRYFGHAKEDE